MNPDVWGIITSDDHREERRHVGSLHGRIEAAVGHAYAGMVVTGVAEVCPQRLAHLVYVNGVVPQDGEAMVDQLNAVRGTEFTARVRMAIESREDFLPPPTTAEEIRRRWAIADPEHQIGSETRSCLSGGHG